MTKNEEILAECGARETDEVFRVTRSFFAITKAGPWTPLPVGSLARLSPATVADLFPFKILPVWLDLEKPARYETLRDFRSVDENGYWLNVNKGDIIELDFIEAEPLLKTFTIKPIRPKEVTE